MEKAKVLVFFNWTEEDFTYRWDSVEYTFESGQSMMLEEGIALHFAKHLANRELNKQGKLMTSNLVTELMAKCFPKPKADKTIEKTPANVPTGTASKPPFCTQCDSKGIKHKKECPTLKTTTEDEFEGLNDTK